MRTSLQPLCRKLKFKWCTMVSKVEATTIELKAVQVTGFWRASREEHWNGVSPSPRYSLRMPTTRIKHQGLTKSRRHTKGQSGMRYWIFSHSGWKDTETGRRKAMLRVTSTTSSKAHSHQCWQNLRALCYQIHSKEFHFINLESCGEALCSFQRLLTKA